MIAFHILFALLAVSIALSDFLFYRIPNILVGLFLLFLIFKISFFGELGHFTAPGITLVVVATVGFLFFWLGFLGAGDAKILAVTSAWAMDQDQLPLFLLIVSLLGAVLALAYLIFGKHLEDLRKKTVGLLKRKSLKSFTEKFLGRGAPVKTQDEAGRQMMPYGVAVSLGCLILIMMKV